MATWQETFDTVVAHLRRQGAKAECREPTTQVPACMYRTPEGRKCAAGCLIPDDRYDPSLEFTSIGGSDAANSRSFNAVTLLIEELGHDTTLVEDLQSIHDGETVSEWEGNFRDLAKRFGLHYTRPRETQTGPIC